MKRKDIIKLTSAGLLVIAGNLIPGLLSLLSIQMILTLVVVPATVYLVISTGIPAFIRGILALGFLIINDVLLKFFMFNPTADFDGALFVLLVVEVLAIIISVIVFLIFLRKEFKSDNGDTAIAFLLFCLASILYLYLIGYSQIHPSGTPASKSVALSQKRGIFISELTISNPTIIFREDTFILKNAWLEKELTLERRPVLSKIKETGRYRIVVGFDYRIKNWGYSDKYTFYPAKDRTRGAFLVPEGSFSFVADSLANEYPVTFVRLKKDSVSFILFRNPK